MGDNMSERYYQLAVEPYNTDRYMAPTINVLCKPKHLKERVAEVERDERVMVTKVYDERAQKLDPKLWKP